MVTLATSMPTPFEVRIRPLGHAWKVRMFDAAAAKNLSDQLNAAGWKCTLITQAFDVPGSVLFRVSSASTHDGRDPVANIKSWGEYQLSSEPA